MRRRLPTHTAGLALAIGVCCLLESAFTLVALMFLGCLVIQLAVNAWDDWRDPLD